MPDNKAVHDQITLRLHHTYSRSCYICNYTEIRDSWKEIISSETPRYRIWLCGYCKGYLEEKYGNKYIQKALDNVIEENTKAFELKIIDEMNKDKDKDKL